MKKSTLHLCLTGIVIALLTCVCTIIVLITLEGIELQIDDLATKYNTKLDKQVETPQLEYLSQPDKQQSISANSVCQSEQTKFLEFAARIVMLQEHQRIEDSTEGIARKLACHYGRKALSSGLGLTTYKLEIPCDNSVDVNFNIRNEIKSLRIKDLKEYIMNSRGDSSVIEIHIQIFVQFLNEFNTISFQETNKTLKKDLVHIRNILLMDMQFLENYKKKLVYCHHVNISSLDLKKERLIHRFHDDTFFNSMKPTSTNIHDTSFKIYGILQQFLNYHKWLRVDLFHRVVCMPIPSAQCPDILLNMRNKSKNKHQGTTDPKVKNQIILQ
ncbi:uncharacterized protein [Clytia hemisphaerica]|uniref:uncharacterized protein n=1 Tax=Clytia hemisphaerica TaxID=252671 RepID=UPI0034D7BBCC|eukprot:TCONS_00064078-protein